MGQAASFDEDRRQHFRLPTGIPVEYKFLTREIGSPETGTVHSGVTRDLSGGGLLLRVKLSDKALVADLLTQKRIVGVKLGLPGGDPLPALCRTIWLDRVSDGESDEYSLGLEFLTVTATDLDRLKSFVIGCYWP
ncbi:MAG: PilZ domain-containing protein [Planctomycetota bacterium]